MRRTFLIAQREFLENVKTKGFWLGILFFPVILVASAMLPGFIARKATSTRNYVIADFSGRYEAVLVAAINARDRSRIDPTSPQRRRFQQLPLHAEIASGTNVAALEARLRTQLLAGGSNRLFAAFIIPADFGPGRTNAIRYWCANQADTDLRDLVERTLRTDFRRQEYGRLGLDPRVVEQTEALRVPLIDLNPNKAAGTERVGLADQLNQWAPSVFVYLLWVSIFAVSQMLLNSVIEEKSNRLIEVLLSSVTPGQFMMGKLTGIAAVGWVMLASWLGSLFAVAYWQTQGMAAPAGAGSGVGELPRAIVGLLQSSWLLPAFGFYFLCGYVLYAAIFLTIGSLCNTIKEAQNFMGPMMMVLMFPLFLMPFIPRDPNGPLASVVSWIPLYTPFVMMNRVAAHPPLWQVLGTTLVLLGFIALVLWGCGRIFRIAILRTGQPPRVRELLRWLGRSSG